VYVCVCMCVEGRGWLNNKGILAQKKKKNLDTIKLIIREILESNYLLLVKVSNPYEPFMVLKCKKKVIIIIKIRP